MKGFGYFILFCAAVGSTLYFGGFVGGDANVKLTGKGKSTYNQGISAVSDGVSSLRVQEEVSAKK